MYGPTDNFINISRFSRIKEVLDLDLALILICRLKPAIKIWLDVRYSTFNIQILNVEYRISNSIQHSNRMLNIEYHFECRISNIKLNPTFKSNVEYRISNSIQHSNRMLNIEYQTKSNIQNKCRISNIKLNLTFKF